MIYLLVNKTSIHFFYKFYPIAATRIYLMVITVFASGISPFYIVYDCVLNWVAGVVFLLFPSHLIVLFFWSRAFFNDWSNHYWHYLHWTVLSNHTSEHTQLFHCCYDKSFFLLLLQLLLRCYWSISLVLFCTYIDIFLLFFFLVSVISLLELEPLIFKLLVKLC